MIKFGEYQKINGKTIEISETTLLDNFTGITNGGSLLSKYDNTDVIWDYVKTTNTWGEGTVPSNREDAECIRYDFGFGWDIDTIAIRINDKNNEHPALIKINELRDEILN